MGVFLENYEEFILKNLKKSEEKLDFNQFQDFKTKYLHLIQTIRDKVFLKKYIKL